MTRSVLSVLSARPQALDDEERVESKIISERVESKKRSVSSLRGACRF
jgi:hypothetical protein